MSCTDKASLMQLFKIMDVTLSCWMADTLMASLSYSLRQASTKDMESDFYWLSTVRMDASLHEMPHFEAGELLREGCELLDSTSSGRLRCSSMWALLEKVTGNIASARRCQRILSSGGEKVDYKACCAKIADLVIHAIPSVMSRSNALSGWRKRNIEFGPCTVCR
jgi:hypothetical protein